MLIVSCSRFSVHTGIRVCDLGMFISSLNLPVRGAASLDLG